MLVDEFFVAKGGVFAMTIQAASLFYGITIGVAILAVLASFFQRAGKTQRFLLMLAFFVLMLAIGRWMYVNSDGLSSILTARKIINFTGCWFWFFIFLFIAEYTRYRIHRTTLIISVLLCTYNSVITFLLHIKGVFYTDYSYELKGDLPYFAKGAYTVPAYPYFFAEYAFLISALMLIIIFMVKFHKVRTQINVLTALMIAVPSVAYIVEFIMKPEVSIVPIASAISVILMAITVKVSQAYDMETIVKDIAVEAQDAVVILVSDSRYFIAANEKAFSLLPELKSAVPWMVLSDISERVAGFFEKKDDEFAINQRIYAPQFRNIEDNKHPIDALWLLDVTERSRHQQLMATYRQDLETEVSIKTESLMKTEARLAETLTQTVTALMSMVDAKDRYTSGHSFRVALYAKEISRRLGKSKAEQDTIYVTSLLHDVGKIHVPDEIINKPGKLTKDEFEQMKLHPITGYIMLSSITSIPAVLTGARWHHERYDGRGYPDGLLKDDIPEIARIIAVADSYDAMSSRRSYRAVLPQATVRREIEANRGAQFDPKIADVMLSMIDEDKYYEMRQHDDDMIGEVLILNDSSNKDRMYDMMREDKKFSVREIWSISELYEIESSKYSRTALIIDMDSNPGIRISDIRERCPMLSIICVTGDHSFSAFQSCIENGADNCLIRPFLKDSLIESVAVILHKSASHLSWTKGNVSAWSLGWM